MGRGQIQMKIQSRATQTVIADGDVLEKVDLNFSHMDVATQFKRHIDQYNDKYRAVASEIMSNAMDEVILMISKGLTPKPYEVFFPVEKDPHFIIRDYGRGMSVDQLKENLNPGKTDKNADNVRVGGFGVGMIAPLCLSDFVIKTRQEGIETTAHITIDGGNGSPGIIITSQKPTDKPTGTDVIIPMSTHERKELARAVKEFLEYMPPKLRPVLHNAEEVAVDYFFDKEDTVDLRSEGIPVIAENGGGHGYYINEQATFIIGFRPYTIHNIPMDAKRNLSLIKRLLNEPKFFFPIGYLSVSDNRETLSMDKITSERIVHHFDKIATDIKAHFEKELKAAKNLKDAWSAAQVLTNAYDPVWKAGDKARIKFNRRYATFYLEGWDPENRYSLASEWGNKTPNAKPYELSRQTNGLIAKSVNVTDDRWGWYLDNRLTPDGKIPIFYKEECKNHVQRLKYWLTENIPEFRSGYGVLVFDSKPKFYETWPDCFELVDLDDVEIPMGVKSNTPKARADNLIEHLRKRSTDYYFRDYYVNQDNEVTYRATQKEDLPTNGLILYVPKKGNKLYLPHYMKEDRWVDYGSEAAKIRDAFEVLHKVGAVRKGDTLVFLNATEMKGPRFRAAKETGVIRNFWHYYRTVVQGTSLRVKPPKYNKDIRGFKDAYRSCPAAAVKVLPALKSINYRVMLVEQKNNKRVKDTPRLPFPEYLNRVVELTYSTDGIPQELVALCKKATKLLEELDYEDILEYYVKAKGITLEARKEEK
jgi:hypothetical protein